MKKQLKLNGHMEALRIFYILNAKNSCVLDDRERRYRNDHRPGLQGRGFGRDYDIFELILEMKNQIHKVFFHNYQIILNDLV